MTHTETVFNFTTTTARMNITPLNSSPHRSGNLELAYAERIAGALKGPIVMLCGSTDTNAQSIIADIARNVTTAGEAAQVLAQEGNYGSNNGIRSKITNFANQLSSFGPLLNAARKSELRPIDIFYIKERAENVLKSIVDVIPVQPFQQDWTKSLAHP